VTRGQDHEYNDGQCHHLLDEVFAAYGSTNVISDNGTSFSLKTFLQMVVKFLKLIIPYPIHSQMGKRNAVQTVKNTLKTIGSIRNSLPQNLMNFFASIEIQSRISHRLNSSCVVCFARAWILSGPIIYIPELPRSNVPNSTYDFTHSSQRNQCFSCQEIFAWISGSRARSSFAWETCIIKSIILENNTSNIISIKSEGKRAMKVIN